VTTNIAPSKDELRAAEFMAERELAAMLREVVERSGLDRQEVARRLGVHRSNVSKILNGPRNLTVKMAARLMRASGERLIFSAVPVVRGVQSQADTYRELGAAVLTPAKVKAATNPTSQRSPDKIAV